MLIEVYGPGCYRCAQTVKMLEAALHELGPAREGEARIKKIEDLKAIAVRRVMTPAVAIDGQLVSQGKVPTLDEVREWLQAVPR